jgi:acyl-coenzyme A synthetase/AMP-(fatty) acid ligase/acyl carrier protein
VCVPHRAITRLVLGTDFVQLDANDRVAQAANVSFDATTFEVWGALLNGGTVIGLGPDVTLDPARFAAAIRERGITVLFITTALFNQLAVEVPGIFAPLRCLLFGGEAVDPARVRAVLEHEPPQRLLHVYGPTENTTFSTWHDVRTVPADARTVPIGRPVHNSTAYVLDESGEPAPIGAPGELYVGGDGLALGYFADATLTGDRFVPHPFVPGERLYKTGDLVRWRADGAIEFIGRRDHQVKIRGFRIEIGEIESELLAVPGVRDAVVLCREDTPGEKQLVAYVVPAAGETLSRDDVRAALRERLPEYMCPSFVVPLDAMPLNRNGKIDRAALPAPDTGAAATGDHVAPRTGTERTLATIWADVLRIDRVGVHDNFFYDLGGHSLVATRVVGRVRERFGVDLPLAAIFDHPTIAELAGLLDQEEREEIEL